MPFTCAASASITRTMSREHSLISHRYSVPTSDTFIHDFVSSRSYALHQTMWRQRRYIGYVRSRPRNRSTDMLIVSRKPSPWSRRKRRETPPSRPETLTRLTSSTGEQTTQQECPRWTTYCSEALAIDPHNRSTNAKLYFNRATVAAKLKRTAESIADCDKALELDPSYTKALLR